LSYHGEQQASEREKVSFIATIKNQKKTRKGKERDDENEKVGFVSECIEERRVREAKKERKKYK
jgi:hypothetical protein